MKMPFGKFKGTELSDLEETYFLWLIDIINPDINPSFFKAVQIEFQRRFPPKFSVKVPDHLKEKSMEILLSGFRTLSKKYHPDMGGRNEDMVLLLEAHSFLKGYVEGGQN